MVWPTLGSRKANEQNIMSIRKETRQVMCTKVINAPRPEEIERNMSFSAVV